MEPGESEQPAFYGMEPLAALPVFLKLEGRTALVAGALPPAVWKAELLAAAGAHVRVFDEVPSPGMLDLAARLTDAKLTLVGRRWSPDDLPGVAIAIGAFEDDDEARRFRTSARGVGVPANVIDKPDYCDFQFGTILARSPVVIGISTDGAAPVFGQALRARIEAVLPATLGLWAAAAKVWRPAVQALGLDFRGRRRFWETFSRFALAGGEPDAAVRQACFTAAEGETARDERGRLLLVGSGQGVPGTITLGAVAALQSAECVIYDADVADPVVGLARREAVKREAAGITSTEVADLARNQIVAWLGTGDPGTCARWRERLDGLESSGVLIEPIRAPALCPICPEKCRFRSSVRPEAT